MTNLANIQAQIEKLQKQADAIKTKEFVKTVQEIQQKMLAFGIRPKDLLATHPAKKAAVPKGSAQKSLKPAGKSGSRKAEVKYRAPDGQTWSGRGLKPRWLTALIAEGRSKEEFLAK